MSLFLSIKQQITPSLFEKVLRDCFEGVIESMSTYVPVRWTNEKLLLHHIDTITKIDETIINVKYIRTDALSLWHQQ